MIGSTMAKLWADAGHEIRLSSRHPDELAPLVSRIGKNASAATPADAAAFGEVVMLHGAAQRGPGAPRRIFAPLVAGKVVIDTGNAYEKRDGRAAQDATAHPQGSAGWAAAQFPKARWVKGLNTVYFKVLESEAHRAGDRVGIPLASDDPAATADRGRPGARGRARSGHRRRARKRQSVRARNGHLQHRDERA